GKHIKISICFFDRCANEHSAEHLLMTPERWQEIEEAFHSCLEQDPAERKATLSTLKGRDPDLAQEVEKLLSQFDQAESFIEEPITPNAKNEVLAALFDDDEIDPLIGKTLG